jgi:RHS repeat-associated protein
MRRALRSTVSTFLVIALFAAVPWPASAESPGDTISATEPSSYDLPEGGTVVFNPTDPAGTGATVYVATLETSGATAATAHGTVTAIGNGVDVSATSPGGEDITSLKHEVTIIPATEDQPATDEMTPAIELTFPVSAADIAGIDPATLGVYSRENPGEEWTWVPSAYDSDLGAVVAQSDHLSEFTVMGAAASAAPAGPRIVLDPDADLGWAVWDGVRYGELKANYSLATKVRDRLVEQCDADVVLTRENDTAVVSKATRANTARNHNPDITVTLAFNSTDGLPWGTPNDGGPLAWGRDAAAGDVRLANDLLNQIGLFTDRHSTRAVNPTTALPYSEFGIVPGTVVHLEAMYLNHNHDFPWINGGMDTIADAVYTGILDEIEAQGLSCAKAPTYPTPPSAEEIQHFAELGKQNQHVYGADPVNLSTGNFVTSEKVFNVTGVGDQNMDLALAYNALDGRASQVGNGWNFAYSSRAQLYANGGAMVTLADGRSVFFDSDGAGGFVTPNGARSTLTAVDGGAVLTLADRTSLEFTFDEVTGYGELTRAVDRQGNAYTLTYGPLADASGGEFVFAPLTSITDQAGQTIAVTSTAQGRITAFTHPDGRVWTLGYDANGNLTSVKDGAGRTRSFAYNGKGLLSVVTGADGVQEVTNAYDDVDRVVTQTDGAGNVRTIAYGDNHSTTLTDALGNASTIDHNAKGQATESHDAGGGVTATGYDANDNPTSSVDANGNIFQSTFDAFGRVLTSTTPLGEVTSYTYNATGDLTSITTPDSSGGAATTSFVLNSDGRAVETHLPDGTVTYATYNAYGDVTSITDALGSVTTYAYDARGNTVKVTDALGGITASTYDLANRQTSTTDALGHVTQQAWDAANNLTSTTDALGQVTSNEYDVNGSLTSKTDARGLVTTSEYNVNLQRTAVHHPDGTRTTFAYDAEHHMVKQTNPDATFRTWEYDSLGRATVMIDEAGARWTTVYDAIGNAVATIDPNGNRTATVYDAMRRATATTDAVGNTSTVAYNPAGLEASSTDALGHATNYGYDVAGRLVGTTRPDGSTTSLAYDANGQTTSETDARGFTTSYEYDALGHQTAMVDALGGRTASVYDATGNLTSMTNALGARTGYAYDALSRRVSVTDALGGALTTAYDPVGNVLTSTDALGRASTFTYDAMSRVASTALPDGAITGYGYNTMGDLVTFTNALGATAGYEYDPVGRQTAKIDEAGQRWSTEYDAAGNAIATVDPAGARTTTEYDAAGRKVATTDALGNRTSRALDAVGAVAAATDALGRTTSYNYDAMGRVTSVGLPDGTTNSFGYDAEGNKVSSTDGRGFTTSFEFDALGRQTATVDALGGRSSSEYDALGNVTAKVDAAGARTSLAYDALSRLVSATNALGGTTTSKYDAAGNVVKVTDALGHATEMTYDPMNRVATSTLADGATTANAYDALGHVVSVTDPLGAVTRHEYDAVGRETASVDAAGGRWVTEYDVVGNVVAKVDPTGASTAMVYDALGEQVSSADPAGAATVREFDAVGSIVGETDALGQTTTYGYDARNRMTSATTPLGAVTEFGYDANGNATSTRSALGDVATVEFDALNRGVAQVAPDGGRSVTTYDAMGRVLSQTDANGATKSYAYDALGRTTTSTDGEGFTTANAYDAVGNVLSITDPLGGVQASAYDVVNRPVSVTDAVGAKTTTVYDLAGRVVSTTDPVGVVKRFGYDARGLLTATTENFVAGVEASASVNVTTSTGYDARGLATSVTDPRGNVTTYAFDAAGRLTGEVDALGRTTSTQFDALGRPTAVTAADGSVTATSYTADGYAAKVAYPDQTVTSTYDAVGDRVGMVDHLGASSWVYDWAGRVTSETDARGNTQTHAFDAVGNEVQTDHSDGSAVRRVFDARGLAVSQTDLTGTSTYSYDADGRMSKVKLASGVTTTVARDGVGRVTSMDHVGVDSGVQPWLSPRVPGAPVNGWDTWWYPTAVSTDVSLDYTYDALGLVSRRDLVTDGVHDVTTYVHDALGRLVSSVSVKDSVAYGWDAASNLVSESHTDDLSTAQLGDSFAVVRVVDAVNELVRSVKKATWNLYLNDEVSTFTYDGRGNRVSETTKEGNPWWSQVIYQADFTYDGRDDVVTSADTGGNVWWGGDDKNARFVRDGLGRALTVVEEGVTKNRLFDGLDVVAEGNIQVVRDPSGAVQSEVTTWWDGWQQWGHWATTRQDVLKDVLGSPIAVAVDGVVSKDLQLFGDFGDVVDAAAWTLVTGFTGQPVTDGLTEFATRTYDAASRVWLQDDSYRGTTTRSASLNRYAYVEGAPESFVDVLGFYRARAAVRAQALAAAQAAYDAALKAYNAIVSSNAHMQDRLFQREVGQVQAQATQRAYEDTVRAANLRMANDRAQGQAAASNKPSLLVQSLSSVGSFFVTFAKDTWDVASATVEMTPFGEAVKFVADPGFYLQEKREQWDAGWQNAQWAYHHPVDAWVAVNVGLPTMVFNSVVDPIKQCWNAGDYGCAVGHTTFDVFLVASMFADGAGIPSTAAKVESGLAEAEAAAAEAARVAEVARAAEAARVADAAEIGIPGASRLSSGEQATAARLQELPEFAGRTFTESPHVGAEYVDDLGRTYDAMGEPAASTYWNETEFLRSIDRHIVKSNDFTVIDLSGFTPEQVAAVTRYVDSLSPEAQATIVRIGF